jgi:hypothetical protein
VRRRETLDDLLRAERWQDVDDAHT